MTRTQRSLLYVGAGLATGIAIAVIVLFTMTRTEFGMERVRLFAVDWLTERVDGEVHVGSIGGRGLLGGVTLREFYIIDKRGRPFMRMDSATLSYNWRTLARGQIVIEDAVLYDPEIYFEQLPGDTIWNFQHVFPDRSEPGAVQGPRRLIMFDDARIVNGTAVVRIPYETPADAVEADNRMVIDTLPGGYAKVMRFDSLHGRLSRVLWESPAEEGRLFDVRSMSGRGFMWRDPMTISGLRGTVTMRDTIVAFDMPEVRLPSSHGSAVGRVIMEEGQNIFDVRIDMPAFRFSDLQWLYPRLPEEGGGSGTLHIQSQRPRGILWLARNARLAAPGTRVSGSFGVVTGADSLYFTNVDLRADPLDLELIQDMLPERLPLDGLLVGTVEVKGGLSSLDTKGDIRLGSSGVKWRGTLDVRAGLAAKNFIADMKTLDLAIVTALRPELKLRGRLTGHVEASGSERSMKFAADIHHYLSGYTSSFAGAGTFANGNLEVEMNARPLSLAEIAKTYPALERLEGEARGPIRLSGALDDLSVKADLETTGGRAVVNGRLTRTDQPRYSGDATLYSFRLDQLISELPEMVLDGNIAFDLGGRGLDELTGGLRARLTRGEVRGVDFSDAHTAMTLDGGAARIDTLDAHTLLGRLTGTGRISLTGRRSDTLHLTVHGDSATGTVRGTGTLTGSPGAFDLDANVDVAKLNYRALLGDRVTAHVTARHLGSDSSRIEVRGRADSLTAFGERADTAAYALTYAKSGGEIRVFGGSANDDEYMANAGFAVTEHGLQFTIRDLRLGQHEVPWQLTAPATITTDDHGLTADSIDIRREDGGRVRAAGRIAWHDTSHAPEAEQLSDFHLSFEGVPFAEFALATAGAADVRGVLDGSVTVSGSAVSPRIDGSVNVAGFMLGDAGIDRLGGTFNYADRVLRTQIDAERSDKRVLFAEGSIPLDLAFMPVAERALDRPLLFTLNADSLPATFITAMLNGFTDVRGRVDGLLLARGTTRDPQFNGALTLLNGDAFWINTGVRYRNVGGTIRLNGDRTATLEADAKANGGAAHVSGSIDLTHPRDPGLALTMDAENFLAARRRDAEFTATGRVELRGRFRQPIVSGTVSVERGALFLDEMYRRFQIVELENPLLYDVVDTSLVSLPTILRTQNPFVKNLTIRDLRVSVGRESWLRSRDLNVEVGGDLTIAFLLSDTTSQRSAQDLRLTGTLRAARGTYQLAGPGISRRFAIREGTIEFPGTPGVDPGLAFNAVYRARSSRRDEPIDIIAVVGGTLRSPQIRLTSDDETLISESDLASYLFFGVPTYELTASQSEAVSQATAGFSFAASSGFGYLANSLQTFAQSFGLLDYVSLTAAEVGIQPQGAIASLFAGTRLELGRYVGREGQVYIAYSQSLTANGYRRPGVRVEWQVMPTLTGELFVEDRFSRTPDFGIQDLSPKRVYGLFLFREWAY